MNDDNDLSYTIHATKTNQASRSVVTLKRNTNSFLHVSYMWTIYLEVGRDGNMKFKFHGNEETANISSQCCCCSNVTRFPIVKYAEPQYIAVKQAVYDGFKQSVGKYFEDLGMMRSLGQGQITDLSTGNIKDLYYPPHNSMNSNASANSDEEDADEEFLKNGFKDNGSGSQYILL